MEFSLPVAHRVRAAVAQQRGFSLVELMVAVTLSLLLLGGVVAIFTSSRVSYETTDQLSHVQESGRFALEQIVRHVRTSGYVGCARQTTYVSSSLNSANLLQWNFLEGPVRGYQASGDDTWAPGLDASVESPASGSDVLVLRGPRLDAEPLRLTAPMAGATAPLTVTNLNTGVQAGDVAMAYSCEAQSFFYVTSFSGGVIGHAASGAVPGNANASVSYTYRADAEVVPVETVVYYIRQSTAAVPPGNTLPVETTSLWRRIGMNNPEELVEGVEQMQLRFGFDTNGDRIVDDYRDADDVTNWQNVFSVTVALLVRSLEQYGTDTDQRTYQLLDTAVATPGDRRLREVFTATTGIRNRMTVD